MAGEEQVTGATVELARVHSRMNLWLAVINGLSTALTVASFGIPLYLVYLTVGELAGKNTQVSPATAYTVAAMVGGSSGLAVFVGGWAKYNAQRKELIRLRERIARLEERLRKRK